MKLVLTASIDHPYVCKIFATGESDGNAIHRDGVSRRHRLSLNGLKSGPLQLEDALKMAD